jgi:hypothetical protein
MSQAKVTPDPNVQRRLLPSQVKNGFWPEAEWPGEHTSRSLVGLQAPSLGQY